MSIRILIPYLVEETVDFEAVVEVDDWIGVAAVIVEVAASVIEFAAFISQTKHLFVSQSSLHPFPFSFV